MNPLVTLALSMFVVIGLIVWVRLHPFLSLLVGGVLVGLVTPSVPLADAATAVATEFGAVTGRIGIIIALASFIGIGLQQSGGAARIGAAFLALAGPRRAHLSMWASGYVLSIPVFFDTVFYLLTPLVKAMYARTRSRYSLYLMAVMVGGAATHVFVPPTPGPLAAAAALKVDLGLMIGMGAFVALCGSVGGLLYAGWAFRRWPDAAAVTRAEIEAADSAAAPGQQDAGPSLVMSFLPIVLPVVLIAARTASTAAGLDGPMAGAILFFGDPNVALFIAAVSTMWLLHSRGVLLDGMSRLAEDSFASAGTIILITAAGGAYGGMLTRAGVGASLAASASDAGLPLLLLAFLLSSLLKFAQGSSTVAIITTASVLQATYSAGAVGVPHPVYAALAAAAGSLVGSWMNDSGFWVIAKMGGLTNAETLRLWSVAAAVVGTTGFLAVVVLQFFLPLR